MLGKFSVSCVDARRPVVSERPRGKTIITWCTGHFTRLNEDSLAAFRLILSQSDLFPNPILASVRWDVALFRLGHIVNHV